MKIGASTISAMYVGGVPVSAAYLGGVQVFGGETFDPDAEAYITAVETADGEALEAGVKDAINDFVVGCKLAEVWGDIEQCFPMAGARTLSGCLVPLKGPAPTNFNFVSDDYDRKTGLLGDGSTKYINTNRRIYPGLSGNLDEPRHVAFYINSFGTSFFYGDGDRYYTDRQNNFRFGRSPNDTLSRPLGVGFVGIEHEEAAIISEADIIDSVGAITNRANVGDSEDKDVLLFGRRPDNLSAARIAFWSIGGRGVVPSLKPLVDDLMTALDGAIA